MKKVLFLILSILVTINFNIFAQEIIIVDTENTEHEKIIENYNNYSSMLKEYLITNQNDYLKSYASLSDEFYNLENTFSPMLPYLITESLFYWNFFRNKIDDENSKNIIDNEIILFWNYLKENFRLGKSEIVAYNYVKSFSSIYNVEFVLPIENFSIEDFKFQNDESHYELISDTKMRNDFYYNLSKVEGMLFRLNKNKEVLDVPMAMSEKSFYEVCNNPKFLYIIFNDKKYNLLLDSFIKTSELLYKVNYFDFDKTKFENKNYILPKNFYDELYSLFSVENSLYEVSLQYEFCNLFSSLLYKSLKEGFDISTLLNETEVKFYNKILENFYFAFCIDIEFINSFLENTKFLLNLDYSKYLMISNLKTEGDENE